MTRTLCALLVTLCSASAPASMLELYGFQPRASAMAGAQTSVADDFTATFYNPAGLALNHRVVTGAGYVVAVPSLGVELSRPAVGLATPAEPPGMHGLTVGALFPLGAALDDRVAIGLGVYLPSGYLARGEMLDPRTPQFYRYQNLPQKIVVLAGAALEITPWLHAGIGLQTLSDISGKIDLSLDLPNAQVRPGIIQVNVPAKVSPTAGVLLTPFPGLRFGASYRQAIQLDFRLPSRMTVNDLFELEFDARGTVLYSPTSFNFGVAYEWAALATLLTVDVGYALWSRAPDPSLRIDVDFKGELVESLGLEERLDVASTGRVDLGFRDTTRVCFGLEHEATHNLTIRAGYGWRPSPAPVPTETYNYIDNDAHVIAGGADWTFRGGPAGTDVHLELGYQATVVGEMPVTKRAGDADPVGDYTAGGVVHALSFAYRHEI